MAQARFRPEERIGLILAVAVHIGVIALLMMRPSVPSLPPPQRMEVSLADDVGLQATSPNPNSPAAADLAPTLGEAKPQAEPTPSKPEERPVEQPQPPPPMPRDVHVERPKPVPQIARPPEPRPSPALPRKMPHTRASQAPDAIGAAIASALSNPHPAPPKTHQPAGGSRIGADFLKGLTSANSNGKANAAPGSVAGPEALAGLRDAVSRALHAHWEAPQGVDADRLVTIVTWDLNPDGTLAGAPRVVAQQGIDASNQPQAARHAEMALRAIRLSEPFQLPPQYYATWKRLTWRFDRNLSQ